MGNHWRLLALLWALFVIVACRPTVSPGGETSSTDGGGVQADSGTVFLPTAGVCANLVAVDPSGTLTTICATAEEIAVIATFIATLRALPDAGPNTFPTDAGGSTPPSPKVCDTLPGGTICVTPAELSGGIRAVLARRARLLTRDAGSPAKGTP